MQRNGPQNDRDRRGTAERGAAQPMNGQPRDESDDDELQPPDTVPSFLTARELEAKQPRTSPIDDASSSNATLDDEDEDDEPVERPLKKGGRKSK